MRFDKFTLKVQEALQEAQSYAGSLGHQAIEPEHLLVCFLRQQDGIVSSIINKLSVSPRQIEQELVRFLENSRASKAVRDRFIFRDVLIKFLIRRLPKRRN